MEERACFAYQIGECTILKVKKCQGSECGFHKTDEENQQAKKKAIERIRTMSEEKRKGIAKKYYYGRVDLFEV